ncbi:hypothetical protein HJC23_004252 [Cyclotella cryptica]|uniref:Uncharacterized protein n=1 Tax=Cyclotella cryptica TaxID=29204 RepID=A0ABD3QEC2_9STRA
MPLPQGELGNNDTITLTALRQTLPSIEAQWESARKMVNKLPPHILRLDIGEEITSFYSDKNRETFFSQLKRAPLHKPTSLLSSLHSPLRRLGKGKLGSVTCNK